MNFKKKTIFLGNQGMHRNGSRKRETFGKGLLCAERNFSRHGKEGPVPHPTGGVCRERSDALTLLSGHMS